MPTAVGTGKHPRRNSVESYLLTGYSLPRLEELGPPLRIERFGTGRAIHFSDYVVSQDLEVTLMRDTFTL